MGVFVRSPYIEGIPFTDSISIESDFVTIEDVKDLIKSLHARPTFTKIQCHQCGASFDQKADDHIFKCPYCRTAYFVGTEMINDEP